MIQPARVQEAGPVPGVMGGWSRGLLGAREPWRQHWEPSGQGLGRWPQASLFSPPFIFVCRDLSFEMALCVSLSAGLGLELPVPQQEPMELGHRPGRMGKQGHAECTCRASGGTPEDSRDQPLPLLVLLWPLDLLCGPDFLEASI